MKNNFVNIIGAGLAGSEAAYFLATHGIKVKLYEMRPKKTTGAHHTSLFGELVCSNSLKSTKLDNACGLLKYEIQQLNSIMMQASEVSLVEGGNSLNVDRDKFATFITEKIKNNPNIEIIYDEFSEFKDDEYYIVCTGPLSSEAIVKSILNITNTNMLSFFDASAPIIKKDSINMDIAYYKSRYDQGEATYINCPMSKEQYYEFVNELVNAKTAELHSFDTQYFEGCMPVEVMAKRGIDTLRYGPLKPKGLWRDENDRSFAVIQLRQDTLIGDLYNIVGFQTNLTYPEQKRVFSMIPGLENAEFVRYGLMHRNTFICAPSTLNIDLSLKNAKNIYIAGQLSGVEGYVESAASGLYAAINIYKILRNCKDIEFPRNTMLYSLVNYIVNANPINFSPMNANFAIMYGVNKLNKIDKANESINAVIEFNKLLNEQN